MTASLLRADRGASCRRQEGRGQAADALAVSGQSLTVDLRQGQLEQAERAEGTEIGLRVLIGRRQACVSASDISAATIAALAERAVAMAREAPEDPTAGLADPSQLTDRRDAAALDLCDPSPEPAAAVLEAQAREAEAVALAAKGITQVETSATWARREMHLAASNGFAGGYARSSHSLSAVAFCGEGTAMERDWAGEGRVYGSDMPGAGGIGALAAERALERLGAVKPPTGRSRCFTMKGWRPRWSDTCRRRSTARHRAGASWAAGLMDQPCCRGFRWWRTRTDTHRRFAPFDAEGWRPRRARWCRTGAEPVRSATRASRGWPPPAMRRGPSAPRPPRPA